MTFGQRVELTVVDRDDPIEATYDARDIRAYEAATGKSALDGLTVTALTYFGWSAARRAGLLNGTGETWTAFDAVCTGVRVIGETKDVRPTRRSRTQKRASDGSSARSRSGQESPSTS